MKNQQNLFDRIMLEKNGELKESHHLKFKI